MYQPDDAGGAYWYDAAAADRVCRFLENLYTWEGEWGAKRLQLMPWQRRIVRDVFGWKRQDGTRRYRRVYIEIPRKNGKTTLGAPIAAYLMLADGEPGAQVYTAACNLQQACYLFNSAKNMLLAQPTLRRLVRIVDSEKTIYHPGSNSHLMALSKISESKHGSNPHAVTYDELHTVRDRGLYNALTSGMGARRQPLLWITTTAGYDRASLCWELHQYAKALLTGEMDDPEFYPVVFGADDGDDWTDERTWARANPSYGTLIYRSAYETRVREGLGQPSVQAEIERYNLNRWTGVQKAWLDLGDWDACIEPDLDTRAPAQVTDAVDTWMRNWPAPGATCWAGLDLSSTLDLTAAAFVFPDVNDERVVHVRWRLWLPGEDIKRRQEQDSAPYVSWVRQGWLCSTDGPCIDHDAIRRDMQFVASRYRLVECAYDPWNAHQLSRQLEDIDGITMVVARQGYETMNKPSKSLEARLKSRTLLHDGNPVARWCAGNAMVRTDDNGNIQPSKRRSTGRIDALAAAVIALWRAETGLAAVSKTSVYEDRGLIML